MDILSSWVNPKHLKSTSLLKKNFISGRPFEHIIIKDFLIEKKAEELANAVRSTTFIHKESDLFSLSQTEDLSESKNKIISSFYSLTSSEEFARFFKELTGISVKPGALDFAGSLYESGDYLLCHDDQVEDRKIAYILYLSRGFVEKDGARFVLFDNKSGKPAGEKKAYVPEWNSLMAFAVSDVSFHSVEENCSKKDRYAIGGWLH